MRKGGRPRSWRSCRRGMMSEEGVEAGAGRGRGRTREEGRGRGRGGGRSESGSESVRSMVSMRPLFGMVGKGIRKWGCYVRICREVRDVWEGKRGV